MSIGTRLFTWWRGELVGTDQFGNRYFRERGGKRRWVLYAGEPEASKVPPEWHAWLHRTVEDVPAPRPSLPWAREHVPNPTGTDAAYRPPGALEHGGRRAAATGDYEAWRPD
ncbi:MAG: NADH:ubiquinone oxidoreductase subunit NDUFA12 [Alphaproteobacteria bacterium]|nr:NADH:ubiquinone oxidoreductase subunit NDUFA12 [Alphaproteobacteria bacterium]